MDTVKNRVCLNNVTNCPLLFKRVDFNLRVTSISCSITVNGTDYPDLLKQVSFLQRGTPERLYLPTILSPYTPTTVGYTAKVPQPNFPIASGEQPMVHAEFSDTPAAEKIVNCTITGEVMPGA